MTMYRYKHLERAVGMILKAIGLPPRGRVSGLAARGAWVFMCKRRDRFKRVVLAAA